jgi:hypothetical protein
MTEHRMTEHLMTGDRMTQHRKTERQKYSTSNRTQRQIEPNIKRLSIKSAQRRKNVRMYIEFERRKTEHRKIPLLHILISLLNF